MGIIKYLKSSKVAVILITLLLIIQAFADLSLPRYTSDLVDVGIQQGGIEHASPDEMSADTFNYICMLASEADEDLIRIPMRKAKQAEKRMEALKTKPKSAKLAPTK